MTSKKGGGGRRRRSQTHPQTRPRRPGRPPGGHDGGDASDQPLFASLRQSLRSSEPLDLLATVSGLLEVTDPRRRSPFAAEQLPYTLDDLVDSFIDQSYAETTAALTAIRALTGNELLAARIGRELANRRQPMPEWLAGMDRAVVDPDVWFVTHVLGDGDNYLVGVTLPSGHCLSALIYVDHNMGTLVKDAFIVPQPLADLSRLMAENLDDVDQTMTLVDPATARAAVEDAIATGSMFLEQPESDSWPMCRPIVEWMLRMLPAGGAVAERTEWTDPECVAIAEAFLASPMAADLDDDQRGLLEPLLWFGTDYGPGDPLRWSPVNVEILLVDWFPRKVHAPVDELSKLPDLLRAFVRYSHAERGIRSSLTAQTLASVDQWEPVFWAAIRTDGPSGMATLLAGMFGGAETDDWDFEAYMIDSLAEEVGGPLQLMALDDDPLPDEPFAWAGIPDDIRPVVTEYLQACDRVADELFDVEHRTAMRRLLSRAAVGDPAIFRRRSSTARGAAAVAWLVTRANRSAGGDRGSVSVGDLIAAFGVTGSVSQRAEPLLRAIGVDPFEYREQPSLGTPDLLTSRTRAAIMGYRDALLEDDDEDDDDEDEDA